MSETQACDRWEIGHCVFTDNPNIIKCKFCPTIYSKSQMVDFAEHLYYKHHITELTEHPNRDFLEKNFNINAETGTAWCILCVIHYKSRVNGTYLLQNHYEIFHSINVGVFNTVMEAEYDKKILNNFILTDKEATCISCNRQINIEHLKEFTLDILTDLVKLFFSYNTYGNNFFYI